MKLINLHTYILCGSIIISNLYNIQQKINLDPLSKNTQLNFDYFNEQCTIDGNV